MSTSDRVVEILIDEAGYRKLPMPLKVGSQTFGFTHALVASNRANDLVIVIELKGDTADTIVVRKVLALTRALDVLHSRRPVTAVLTSGQPRSETVRSISKVCRVLSVGSPSGPDAKGSVRDWLAALLPLSSPPAVDETFNWEVELHSKMATLQRGAFEDDVIQAAPRGPENVEAILRGEIRKIAVAALDEGAPR